MRNGARSAALVALILVLPLGPLSRSAVANPVHATMEVAGSMVPHAPSEIKVTPGLKQVLQGLLCQCGCNLDAYQCQQTMTCNVSTDMWKQAEELVDRQGKTPQEALALFATDYGEYVLASPTKTGFNLTVWYLPFVVIAVGAMVLAFALRGWRPRGAEAAAATDREAPHVDQRYLDVIERELREED
jgi:cytochrome c-type biogenesis protein CcmH